MTPKGKKRFEERIDCEVVLLEAQEDKPRRVRFEKAMTADIVNGNNRRYPAQVLQVAVKELRDHLHESAGQGRAIQLLGEAEHPSDKSTRRPNLLETVVKWEEVNFDGVNVNITGCILETSKGKDILTLMEGGVMPGVSMRGYGDGKFIKASKDGDDKGKEKIFEVSELHITGFDMLLEPSFENVAQLIESITGDKPEEDEMDKEEVLQLLKDHPEVFEGITEAQVKKMGEAQLKALEESVRKALGIDENANINESLKAMAEKAQKFEEAEKKAGIENAIEEATKELPYGEEGNKLFVEELQESAPHDEKAVAKMAESLRKRYDKLFAGRKLEEKGFTGEIKGVQPLFEKETGVPEFAKAAYILNEAVVKSEMRQMRDFSKAETRAELLTIQILERFDALNKHHLAREAKEFEEAEQTSDLNLPYSVSRAIIAEAYPTLVAAGIFDVGTIETSPTRLYFEAHAAETGYTATVTDEAVTAGAADAWVDLDYGRVTPGTVVVTTSPAGTTYTENTDFVIDYADGRIKILAAGSISEDDALLVDYGYTAIRKGEMVPIERAKISLSYITVEAAADRLADQISREAIVFSRSQLGYDAVSRTMASLIRQTQRKIDQGLLYMALAAVKSVASNSGGTWTTGNDESDYDDLVRLLGETKVIVANRYYTPNFFLMSYTNSEDLSNWRGFRRDGFPNAILNAAGYAGNVKGLPVFASTEFPDDTIIVGNRQLVMHRVFQPMVVRGPFPTYDVSGGTSKLVAADQYYTEEFNVTESPVEEKGAYLGVTAGS